MEIGARTGTETDAEAGTETGAETGAETGTETGTETGDDGKVDRSRQFRKRAGPKRRRSSDKAFQSSLKTGGHCL